MWYRRAEAAVKESIAASDAARAQITQKKQALEEAARGRTEALLKVIIVSPLRHWRLSLATREFGHAHALLT